MLFQLWISWTVWRVLGYAFPPLNNLDYMASFRICSSSCQISDKFDRLVCSDVLCSATNPHKQHNSGHTEGHSVVSAGEPWRKTSEGTDRTIFSFRSMSAFSFHLPAQLWLPCDFILTFASHIYLISFRLLLSNAVTYGLKVNYQ